MRYARHIFAASVVLTLLTNSVIRAQTSARREADPRAATVVFMVSKWTGGVSVEPVVQVERGGRLAVPNLGEDGHEHFNATYYRAGQRHRLIFGGAEAGSVIITQAEKGECAGADASAELETSVKLGGAVRALAVSAPTLGRAKGLRRAPTESERAEVLRLAETVYRRNRVAAAALARTQTINLTATDLDADGAEEFIGSFLVKSGARTRELLFLIAERRGRGLAVAHSVYEHISDRELMNPEMIDEIGVELFSEAFIDQLDLDGDGVGEVFTSLRSFEGSTFKIYQKRRGRWREAYDFYSYRCGY
ncbi:MAG TPA: hypothetical protein VGV59_14090 [Pyrinomonadaceae bacterium]|nr:hypothetical protein [Pyrinomonadaceae bacterium]